MNRLYVLDVNAREAEGVTVVSYPVVSDGKKGVLYQYNDRTHRRYARENMNVYQLLDHETRGKCVFCCSDDAAAEEIRMRTLLLIDALHTEGQRRAANLAKMEDEHGWNLEAI